MSKDVAEKAGIKVPMRWGPHDDLQTTYANHLLITHGGKEFYLVFGEAVPPTSMDEVPEYVRIEPVARIAVSPETMLGFAEVIHTNVRGFLRKLEEAEVETGEREEK
jgi:hypothetical protein